MQHYLYHHYPPQWIKFHLPKDTFLYLTNDSLPTRYKFFFAWRIDHWFYRGQERPDLQPDSWDQFRRFGFVAPIRVGRLVRPVFKYFWDRTMSRGSGRCGVRWKSPRSPEWNLLFDSNVSQRKGFIANRPIERPPFPIGSFLRNRTKRTEGRKRKREREKKKRK